MVPLLRVRDKEVRGTRREALNPGETVEETLLLPIGELGKGRWPFRVAVDYTDANQYPFQALHVALFTIGDPSPAKVAVPNISIPPLADSTDASFTAKNLAGVARDASVTLFAPDGIEATEPTKKLALPPWGTETAEIELVNRTALAGSRYPLFVAVEYDEDGMHQAVIANGMVEIRQRRALVSRGLLWAIGGLLVFARLVLILRQQRALSRAANAVSTARIDQRAAEPIRST